MELASLDPDLRSQDRSFLDRQLLAVRVVVPVVSRVVGYVQDLLAEGPVVAQFPRTIQVLPKTGFGRDPDYRPGVPSFVWQTGYCIAPRRLANPRAPLSHCPASARQPRSAYGLAHNARGRLWRLLRALCSGVVSSLIRGEGRPTLGHHTLHSIHRMRNAPFATAVPKRSSGQAASTAAPKR